MEMEFVLRVADQTVEKQTGPERLEVGWTVARRGKAAVSTRQVRKERWEVKCVVCLARDGLQRRQDSIKGNLIVTPMIDHTLLVGNVDVCDLACVSQS